MHLYFVVLLLCFIQNICLGNLIPPTHDWDFRTLTNSSTNVNDSESGLTSYYMNGIKSNMNQGAVFTGGNYIELQGFQFGNSFSFETYMNFNTMNTVDSEWMRIFDFSSGPGNATVFLSQYGSDNHLLAIGTPDLVSIYSDSNNIAENGYSTSFKKLNTISGGDQDVVIMMNVEMPTSSNENRLLFEAGGAGAGTFVGIVGGNFRINAGDGGTGATTGIAVISISLPDSRIPLDGYEHSIHVYIWNDEGKISLYIDGIFVATATVIIPDSNNNKFKSGKWN